MEGNEFSVSTNSVKGIPTSSPAGTNQIPKRGELQSHVHNTEKKLKLTGENRGRVARDWRWMSLTGQRDGACADTIVFLLNHSELTRLLQFVHLQDEARLNSWREWIQSLCVVASWLNKQQCAPASTKMAESCMKNTFK